MMKRCDRIAKIQECRRLANVETGQSETPLGEKETPLGERAIELPKKSILFNSNMLVYSWWLAGAEPERWMVAASKLETSRT